MQVGYGYDVHRLVAGRPFVLAGVTISHQKGLKGWSDGDVLTHAIIDAILGAMGEGDIGQHFPAGDPKYKGIASLKLLKFIDELLRNRGYAINNIDCTLVLEKPKIAKYIADIKANLAKTLAIEPSLINIKGKTEEGLGFTGTGRGVAAHAVCLVHKEVK